MVELSQLKLKALRGGKWLVINQVVTQTIRILVSILLTRILLPYDFGIVAKTFSVTGIVELVFVQGAIGTIIQDKNITKNQIHTLFIIAFLGSIIISIIMYFLSYPIAYFYEDNKIIWTTKIATISILFSGLSLVPSALIRKELNFRYVSIASIIALLISSVVALYMANTGYAYKAIIFQFVINSVINSVLLLAFSKIGYQFNFKYKEVIPHIRFSLHMTGTNILNYMVRNTDDISLGKFQSTTALGLYARAYFLMLTPINIVNQILNQLLFPVYSIIQDDQKKISKIFIKSHEIIILLTYPIITLFFFNADLIIKKILGVQWVNSVGLFRIFIPLLLIQLFTSSVTNIFMTYKKTEFLLKYSLLTKPILIVAIIISAWFGPFQVALSIVILSGTFGIILYKKCIEIIKVSFISDILKKNLVFLFIWGLQIGLQIITYAFATQKSQFYLSVFILVFVYFLYILFKPESLREFKTLLNINRN